MIGELLIGAGVVLILVGLFQDIVRRPYKQSKKHFCERIELVERAREQFDPTVEVTASSFLETYICECGMEMLHDNVEDDGFMGGYRVGGYWCPRCDTYAERTDLPPEYLRDEELREYYGDNE